MKKTARAQVITSIVRRHRHLDLGPNEFYMLEEDEMEHGLRIIVD